MLEAHNSVSNNWWDHHFYIEKMLPILLKLFCIVQIVFFLKSVESVFPSASNGVLRGSVQLPRTRSSSSVSSTSSLLSKHQHLDQVKDPVASTSKLTKNRINQETRTREKSSINLNEASVQTNVPFSELNPSRDGFFARVNQAFAKQAASALAGAAVGYAVDEWVHRKNNTTSTPSTTTTTSTTAPTTTTSTTTTSTTTEENILVQP